MSEPSAFSTKPTLRGRLATLRPFTPNDISAMGRILADPDVVRLTGSAHSSAQTQGRDVRLDPVTLRWYQTRAEQEDRLDLAVIDNASGRCVGEVVLNEWRPEDHSCNFRILLGPSGRDRGIGSEATGLMLDYAFLATGLNRIELEVYAFNPRAQRVYEKAGFTVEGRRRDAFRFDGVYIDAVVMSVLRREWTAAAGRRITVDNVPARE